jgi:hypothetical protein
LSDEQLQLYGRRIELGIETALEPQRRQTVGLFGLTRVVALCVVGRASAGEFGTCLRAFDLHRLPFLRQLKLGYSPVGLREVDVSLRAEPVEERP